MLEPHVHVAFAPHEAGVLCAAFWIVQHEGVCGWFTGARGDAYPSSFFVLEDYYTTRDTVCHLSAQSDIHGPWRIVSTRGEASIEVGVPLPEHLCPELDHLQDAFVREWLFYRDQPGHDQDIDALRKRDLAIRDLNLRPRKLNKMQGGTPVWTYTSPGADLNVIAFLGSRWSLDYAPQ